MNRITACFERLAAENRAALITFVMAGDGGAEKAQAVLDALPAAGADIIELGMPFSDPVADGPSIQMAGQRALDNGHRMADTLEQVRRFRAHDNTTPIVLMGYGNTIYFHGVEAFIRQAKGVGVDGLIIVDIPAEHDAMLAAPARLQGLDVIQLATPTTDDVRLPSVLQNSSGFLYYVSIAGVTGSQAPDVVRVRQAVERLKMKTDTPVAVGFGVRSAEQAAEIGAFSDGVVVGSALVEAQAKGHTVIEAVENVRALTASLAEGVYRARQYREHLYPNKED